MDTLSNLTHAFRSELLKLEYIQTSLEVLNAAVHSPSTLPPHTVPMQIDRITEELGKICKVMNAIADTLERLDKAQNTTPPQANLA